MSTKKLPIIVTPIALKKLYELISRRKMNNEDTIGIRIKIVNKGCGGQKYKMEYVENQDKHDELINIPHENKFVSVFLDPKTFFIIIGTKIDYVTDKFETGFTFKNPKEKGRCGCGESFYF